MRITKQSTDYIIYKILIDKQLSGEEIGKKLGITRSAVWKVINKLKNYGLKIDSDRKGYRITEKEELNPYEVADIAFKRLGEFLEEVIYYESTDSTNERAKEYGKPRVLFFAESQTAGKGRLGRRWDSKKGGLYFSISLESKFGFENLPKLTLIAGLAVAEALDVGMIKWPNDVLINGKKVCGILSEIHGEIENPLIVIGIGINVSNPIPDELKNNAASINEFYRVGRRDVFDRILLELNKLYRDLLNGKWPELRRRFVERCETIGKIVKVITPTGKIVGLAENIDDDGALIVDGIKVYAGDCIHLRNCKSQ